VAQHEIAHLVARDITGAPRHAGPWLRERAAAAPDLHHHTAPREIARSNIADAKPTRKYVGSDRIGIGNFCTRRRLCDCNRVFHCRMGFCAMSDGEIVQRYLTRARCCVEIAGTMSDVQQRLILLDMAQVWIRLANQAGANESTNHPHETSNAAMPSDPQPHLTDLPSAASPPLYLHGQVVRQTGYVAIVDDDAAVRQALTTLLRAHGVDTRTYASGPDFLAALPCGVPGCLIADVNMPEMTGLELQAELARRGLRIPTIVITASDNKSYRDKCHALGTVAYFRKPVESATLIAAITSSLGSK
jgi:CheY-like chemotaxis protein